MSNAAPGDVLAGRYRLVRELGRGGMGVVFEAIQLDLERPVALKLLTIDRLDDARAAQRFAREALAAGRIAHPNVAATTDFAFDKVCGGVIVMEYVDGRSLLAVMREGGVLEASRAVYLCVQMLSALGAAHARGVVHRDLKPSNVLLARNAGVPDLVKIADFGVAKLLDEERFERLTATGALLGTPGYMAPEQARGAAIDGRTDLYAAGVVLYQMLSGALPFPSRTPAEFLLALLNAQGTPLARACPAVHPGLAAVVDRAVARNPEDRFASADAMAAALRPFLSESQEAALKRIGTMPTVAMPEITAKEIASTMALAPVATAPTAPQKPSVPAPKPQRRMPLVIWAALASIAGAIVFGLATMIALAPPSEGRGPGGGSAVPIAAPPAVVIPPVVIAPPDASAAITELQAAPPPDALPAENTERRGEPTRHAHDVVTHHVPDDPPAPAGPEPTDTTWGIPQVRGDLHPAVVARALQLCSVAVADCFDSPRRVRLELTIDGQANGTVTTTARGVREAACVGRNLSSSYMSFMEAGHAEVTVEANVH